MKELDKLSKCCKAKLYNRAEAYHSPVNVCTICEKITDEYGNPIITGDSDTDELLEDERVAQEEDICPWGEPLHNHHDGCPSCYIADKYGYKTSEDISKGLKKYLRGEK